MVNYTKQQLKKEYKTSSYRKLGKKYGLSKTRIWQVLTDYYKKNRYYCKIHHRKYWKECILCEVDRRYEGLLSEEDIIKEAKRLRKMGRDKKTVWKRKILITRLRDDSNWTFLAIGKLFKMDNSSIIYLYYKHKTEKK